MFLRLQQAGMHVCLHICAFPSGTCLPRVLIFLEALALGREPPAFGLHLCPPLLAAAQRLGLRPLEVRAAVHETGGGYGNRWR